MSPREFLSRTLKWLLFMLLLGFVTYTAGCIISATFDIREWGFYARGALGWLWYVIAGCGTFLLFTGGDGRVFR